jgi:hypothetical protein
MVVKKNMYSESLSAALEAVGDISHPDYMSLPLEPTPAMLVAAGLTTGMTPEQLRQAYQALVEAWCYAGEDN